MKKHKDVPIYNYSSFDDVEKRIQTLEKWYYKDPVDDIVSKYDRENIRNLKNSFIADDGEFQRFFSSLAEISLSKQYKYNILECLNTLKKIFEENFIDCLSSFIYIHNKFVECKHKDLSIVLKTITNIVNANKSNNNFMKKISDYIMKEEYYILLNERVMLTELYSSFYDNVQQEEQKEKQKKIDDIFSKYYEDFKKICM